MMTHADLIGTNLDNVIVAELNRRLNGIKSTANSESYNHPIYRLTALKMAASVQGNSPEDAYFHVEILFSEFTTDPFLISMGLKGSSYGGDHLSKSMVTKCTREQSNVICEFCRELAYWMTFTGDSSSLKTSLLETINARIAKENPDQNMHLSNLKIFAIKDSGFLQVEMTTSIEGHQMLIFIPSEGKEHLLPALQGTELPEDTDLAMNALIDASFCGDMKSTLDTQAKLRFLRMFRELSNLYFFENSLGQRDSVAVKVDIG